MDSNIAKRRIIKQSFVNNINVFINFRSGGDGKYLEWVLVGSLCLVRHSWNPSYIYKHKSLPSVSLSLTTKTVLPLLRYENPKIPNMRYLVFLKILFCFVYILKFAFWGWWFFKQPSLIWFLFHLFIHFIYYLWRGMGVWICFWVEARSMISLLFFLCFFFSGVVCGVGGWEDMKSMVWGL